MHQAPSVSNTRKRCFLGNPWEALVVCCAVFHTGKLHFVGATYASRVVAKPKLTAPQLLTKSPAFYGTLRFTALLTEARPFRHIHSVHALLYYYSNSLTLSTPMSPTYRSYVKFLHPNPVPPPALVPLSVHNSSPFISPRSLYPFSSAISFSS
jgi:hypothetical protein